MPETKKNALAELAESLEHDNFFGCDHFKREVWVGKAQRIVAELAKIEKPIDKSEVKPSIDGRVHFADILKAEEERAFEVLRNCRAIAEEGAEK